MGRPRTPCYNGVLVPKAGPSWPWHGASRLDKTKVSPRWPWGGGHEAAFDTGLSLRWAPPRTELPSWGLPAETPALMKPFSWGAQGPNPPLQPRG